MAIRLEVKLKPVSKGDIWKIFEWRDQPEVRAMMFDTAPLERQKHEAFWKKYLSNPSNHAFIILADGREAGLVRLDFQEKGVFEVGVLVMASMQGKGIGSAAIVEAKKIAAQYGASSLVARIRPENTVSTKLFERGGFVRKHLSLELDLSKRHVVAIVQARMGSSRLPGKTLADIGGKPLLWHLLFRLGQSKTLDRIVVATTEKKEDDAIADLATRMSHAVFRGSEKDVLARFYCAAKENRADVVVRITADCPLIDPAIVDKGVLLFLEGGADYVSNTVEHTFPNGVDVEVFSMAALERAYLEARLLSEREHVTPYIWKNKSIFRIKQFRNSEDLSKLRWTVDEPRDLELVREIFRELGTDRLFHMEAVLALIRRRPELTKINVDIRRNEGYAKSLKEDRETRPGELK